MTSRKKFLRQFLIGVTSSSLILEACKKSVSASDGTDTSTGSDACVVSPTETAGPYPTHDPSDLVRSDIRVDRTGIPLSITITVVNSNASCVALQNLLVDIWHCDKDGAYSEYGGSGTSQSQDNTSVHFLRGRQTTDSSGEVKFTSIFPGWYSGRATHIHVHVYDASGNSMLITQISFPEGTDSAVVAVNADTAAGYTKGMTGYTYNASDNVFSDDKTGSELATITGSVSDGYVLTKTIRVAA